MVVTCLFLWTSIFFSITMFIVLNNIWRNENKRRKKTTIQKKNDWQIKVNKVCKYGYTTSEAMEYIFAPGSHSELSDLESDSDNDSDFTVEKNVVDAKSESESDTTDTEKKKN